MTEKAHSRENDLSSDNGKFEISDNYNYNLPPPNLTTIRPKAIIFLGNIDFNSLLQ